MRYRPFGDSGLLVSEIGFGTWGLGGTRGGAVGYGPTNDAVSRAALSLAFELGVSFFDTSDLYGHGHAEELLGNVFRECRTEIFLTTKAGYRDGGTVHDFSPNYLRCALEASLKRLRTRYVDLFLLHNPPAALLESQPAIWQCLEEFKRAGKARFVGVSVRSPDEGLAVISTLAPDAIEVNYNLADQRAAENGLFDRCHERGIGVIVRTPLCFGFLTGAYDADGQFAHGDHRNRWSPEQRERWRQAQDIFRDALGRNGNETPAQFALRFCLSHPGVTTVIPGMLTPAHVEENIPASELGPLSSEELQRIQQVYQEQTFFLGK
jgi:aryl-alcohol dehydrogenase-like predicted oxidoreductase